MPQPQKVKKQLTEEWPMGLFVHVCAVYSKTAEHSTFPVCEDTPPIQTSTTLPELLEGKWMSMVQLSLVLGSRTLQLTI